MERDAGKKGRLGFLMASLSTLRTKFKSCSGFLLSSMVMIWAHRPLHPPPTVPPPMGGFVKSICSLRGVPVNYYYSSSERFF